MHHASRITFHFVRLRPLARRGILRAVNPPYTSTPTVVPTQRPDLFPALGWLLGAFGLGSYIVWLAGAGPGSPAMGWDFRAYYAATHALITGGNLYDLGLPNTP